MIDCQNQIDGLELKLKSIKEQRVETLIQKDRLEEEIRTNVISEDQTSSLMQNIVTNHSNIQIEVEEETLQV